jgi:hypothetical protein
LTGCPRCRLTQTMGTLRRRPVPLATDEQIIRALAGVAGRSSPRFQRFRHAGKSYIAFEGAVPAFKAGTLVATGYSFSVVADGHAPTADELSAALLSFEGP